MSKRPATPKQDFPSKRDMIVAQRNNMPIVRNSSNNWELKTGNENPGRSIEFFYKKTQNLTGRNLSKHFIFLKRQEAKFDKKFYGDGMFVAVLSDKPELRESFCKLVGKEIGKEELGLYSVDGKNRKIWLIDPLHYPEKIQPLLYSLSMADMVVVLVD